MLKRVCVCVCVCDECIFRDYAFPFINILFLFFLQGLLQRNPDDRLGFEDFFTHAYLDLENCPSEDSLRK